MLRPSTMTAADNNSPSSSSSCGTASTSSVSSVSSNGTDSFSDFGGYGCGDCQLCCMEFVEVRSPASLREGFHFWATLDNTSIQVTVPAGGTKEGQTIRIPRGDVNNLCCSRRRKRKCDGGTCSKGDINNKSGANNNGRWKFGIFSCLQLGICHPVNWNAMICPQVLLGQILTRMNMTWLVSSSSSSTSNPNGATVNNKNISFQTTFRRIMACLILFTLYDAFMAPPLILIDVDSETGELIVSSNQHNSVETDHGSFPPSIAWHQLFYLLLSLPMSIYGIMIVVKLRAAVRTKYNIPTGRLGSIEDFCYVLLCNCCVLTQLARQTADYDIERPSYCSSNGLISKPSSSLPTTMANPPKKFGRPIVSSSVVTTTTAMKIGRNHQLLQRSSSSSTLLV